MCLRCKQAAYSILSEEEFRLYLMKYIASNELFFVHIPKCAGMSVRQALTSSGGESWAAIAADLGVGENEAARVTERGRGFKHPNLGWIHPAHLPLAAIESQMPKTWEVLNSSRGFGLTRDPRARFISALMQRLMEFKDTGNVRADDPLVAAEAARVCEWLNGRESFSEIDYIHFARQADFANHRGRRILKAMFPIERIDILSRWIATECELNVEFAHEHSRRQPKPYVNTIQPLARLVARNLLPKILKEVLYSVWVNSRFFEVSSKDYNSVKFNDDIENFISQYYRCDIELHAEAQLHAASFSSISCVE